MAPVTPDRLKISDRAHLVFDLHKQADGHQEEQRNKNNEMLGTTKKGIGPCYSSKAYRSGIRMADLIAADFDNKFAERFRRLANDHIKAFAIEVDIEAEIERYRSLADDIRLVFAILILQFLAASTECSAGSNKHFVVEGGGSIFSPVRWKATRWR
jgi:adenylosuccinate synthase